jgi:hypothetical protein
VDIGATTAAVVEHAAHGRLFWAWVEDALN